MLLNSNRREEARTRLEEALTIFRRLGSRLQLDLTESCLSST